MKTMRTVTLTKESTKDILENLLKRSPNNYGKFEAAVDDILKKVRAEGDSAVFAYTKEFDKVEITADTVRVTEDEIREAYDAVDPSLVEVIRKALVNIRSYHEKQKQNSWFSSTEDGTMLGQKVTPLKRVGVYVPGGGVVDPLPEDAPFFVKDYYDYYKTERGYHIRSLNSNDGWNVTGCMSFLNMPILRYSNEIRSAVLIIHGEKAHSCYFSKDAYADMVKDNAYTENKELMIIPDTVHTDLYDGGGKNAIPFDKIAAFFQKNLK